MGLRYATVNAYILEVKTLSTTFGVGVINSQSNWGKLEDIVDGIRLMRLLADYLAE